MVLITGYIGGGGFVTSCDGLASYEERIVNDASKMTCIGRFTSVSQIRLASPSITSGSIFALGPMW